MAIVPQAALCRMPGAEVQTAPSLIMRASPMFGAVWPLNVEQALFDFVSHDTQSRPHSLPVLLLNLHAGFVYPE
jgi:hypothetical protein